MRDFWGACKRYRRRMSLLACDELASAQDEQLHSHLVGCAKCREYQDQITKLVGAITTWETNLKETRPSQATLERWAGKFASAVAKDQLSSETRHNWFLDLYADIIRPYRKSWAAMGVVWLILLAVNLSDNHAPQTASGRESQPSVEVVRAYLANEGFWGRPTVTERPLPHSSIPRS